MASEASDRGSAAGGQPRGSEGADPYDQLAPWYDLEHDAFTEDVEAYQFLLADLLGGQGEIVEVGSGTGRLLAGLVVLGYRVTGVEPSPAMRERAARRVAALPERMRRRITLVGGNALAPDLPPNARFDAALFGLNTLAHLLTAAGREASFRAIGTFLRPGGLLLLDLDLRGPRRLAHALGRAWHQGTWALPNGDELRHWASGRTVRDGVLTLDHTYEVWSPGAEQPTQRVVVPMRLAILSPPTVRAELESAGYAVATHYGDYDLRTAGPRAPRALIVAHRLR